MDESTTDRPDNALTSSTGAVLGLLAACGCALAAWSTLKPERAPRTRPSDETRQRANFQAYLRGHLTGSDAAISVLRRLSKSNDGTPEGHLFAALHRELAEEREVVTALLADQGVSSVSAKRIVGQVAGGVLQTAAGGRADDLSLFRSLESLAIGVQGKRCLWRAAQALVPPLQAPGRRSFAGLEAAALDQWERIEERRRALAPRVFTAAVGRPRDRRR